jgi:hypothetical protein
MILSGHLHMRGVGETTKRCPLPGRAALLIRAGTATSTRRRGEVNAFNVVRVARPEVAIDCMVWHPDEGRFVAASTERFRRTEVGWSRLMSFFAEVGPQLAHPPNYCFALKIRRIRAHSICIRQHPGIAAQLSCSFKRLRCRNEGFLFDAHSHRRLRQPNSNHLRDGTLTEPCKHYLSFGAPALDQRVRAP